MVSARHTGFNLILYGSGSYGERQGAAETEVGRSRDRGAGLAYYDDGKSNRCHLGRAL